jgi:hypothetical protein
MAILLMIIVMVCLTWLLYPQIKERFEKPVPQGTENYRAISRKEADIMGKSRFTLRQLKPNEATESQAIKRLDKESIFAPEAKKSKDAIVAESELEKAFSDTPEAQNEPMDIDIESEYQTDEEPDLNEEAEELAEQYEGNLSYAQGVDLSAIDGTMKTISDRHPTEEQQANAGEVLSQLQGTDMFEQMASGSDANAVKVKSLLAFHIARFNKSIKESGVPESEKHDLTGFLS